MICGNLLLSGATKEALKSGLSDMEYLRSKVATTDDTLEEEDGEGADDEDEDQGPVQHTDSAYESGDRENTSKTKTPASSEEKKQSKAKKTAKQEVTDQSTLNIILLFCFQHEMIYTVVCSMQMEPVTEFTVKLRGVPFNVKEVS